MSKESRRRYYLANRDKWKAYRSRKIAKYPLYTIWHGMLVRTGVRPGANTHDVKLYINRGIRLYESWKEYANFECWALANGWSNGLELDRIDNDGNYEPSNCRFVSPSRNQRNKRNTVFVVCNGTRMALADAYEASKCRFDYRLVLQRVSRDKWPFDRAVSQPPKRRAIVH